MTPDAIAAYSRAVLAHIDAHDALMANDAGLAAAAYAIREQALDEIEAMTGRLRSAEFARVALLARDALTRRAT